MAALTMLSTHPGAPPSHATGSGSGTMDEDLNLSPWAKTFVSDIAGLRSEGVTYQDSADFLRALVSVL